MKGLNNYDIFDVLMLQMEQRCYQTFQHETVFLQHHTKHVVIRHVVRNRTARRLKK